MKTRHLFYSIIICITLLCSISNVTVAAEDSIITVPITSCETPSASSTCEITPYASDIGWKYKTINGVLYKRKYDFTRKQWIGDWIKA